MSETKHILFMNQKKYETLEVLASYLSENEVNVFETMRVLRGQIFLLDEHMTRLFESANTVGLKIEKEAAEIKKELEDITSQLSKIPPPSPSPTKGEGRVGAGSEEFFVRYTISKNYNFAVVFKRSYNPEIYQNGVHLKTSAVKRNTFESFRPEAKTGQFLNGILAQIDPQAEGLYETLFLDRNGFVKEARVSNIFLVRNGGLLTPEPHGILDGVTRRFVIKCARIEGISVRETPISRHYLWNAEEAFLTNTSGGIVPIRSLDGRLIGKKLPGEITKRLTRRYELESESHGKN